MTSTDGEVRYVADVSSGRVHKEIRAGSRWVPYGGEADNLDDAGTRIVLATLDLAEPGELCERCFGKPEPDPEAA